MSKRPIGSGRLAAGAIALAGAIAFSGSLVAQDPIAYPTNPGGTTPKGSAPADSGSADTTRGDEAGSRKGIVRYKNRKQKNDGPLCSDCHVGKVPSAAFDLGLHRKRAPERFETLPAIAPPVVKRELAPPRR
ncbi:MAG: hypothetical protein HKP30_10155 [Myxococcales bacterium]|nr:hypothetical protein [Myxococcales bacterium]